MEITWLMYVLLMCGYHGADRYMYCSMIKLAIGYAMHKCQQTIVHIYSML